MYQGDRIRILFFLIQEPQLLAKKILILVEVIVVTIQDVAHKSVTGIAHQPDDFVLVVEIGKVEPGPYDLLID